MRSFEHELPSQYSEVRCIDVTKLSFGLVLNLLSVVPFFVLVPVFLSRHTFYDIIISPWSILALLFLFVGLIAYIILHELTHGVAYKCMTGQKLTFGISWSCAFCGIPEIYCYRRTALIAVLAPFVVFTVCLVPLFIFSMLTDAAFAMVTGLILGMHLGGCSGDLYLAYLLIFVHRDKCTLVRDTGPKQSFYLPSDASASDEI